MKFKIINENASFLISSFLTIFFLLVFKINPVLFTNDDAGMLLINHGLNGVSTNGLPYYHIESMKFIFNLLNFSDYIYGYWIFYFIIHFLIIKAIDRFLKIKTFFNTYQRAFVSFIVTFLAIISPYFTIYAGLLFLSFLLSEYSSPGKNRNFAYLILAFLIRRVLFYLLVIIFLTPKFILFFKKITLRSFIRYGALGIALISLYFFGKAQKKDPINNNIKVEYSSFTRVLLDDYGGIHRLVSIKDFLKLPFSNNDLKLVSEHFYYDERISSKVFTKDILKLSGVPTGVRPWKVKKFISLMLKLPILVPLIITLIGLFFFKFDKEIFISLSLLLSVQIFFALLGRIGDEKTWYAVYLCFMFKSLTLFKTKKMKNLIIMILCLLFIPTKKVYTRGKLFNKIHKDEFSKVSKRLNKEKKPLYIWGGSMLIIANPMINHLKSSGIPIVELAHFASLYKYQHDYDFEYFKNSFTGEGIYLSDYPFNPKRLDLLKVYCKEHFGIDRELKIEDLSGESLSFFKLRCLKI